MYQAKSSGVLDFRCDMEWISRNMRQTFGGFLDHSTNYTTLSYGSMQMLNPTSDPSHRNQYISYSNSSLFDNYTNSYYDTYPIIYQNIPRQQATHSVDSTILNDNLSNRSSIQIGTPGSYLSIPKNCMEQTEPIDLSKKNDVRTAMKKQHQTKTRDYFEPNSEVSLPLPSNISEAALLILKSVYDVKYHRKPNCDNIFLDDPNNPKLYVCQVCNKKVRSKWHHFQTHYSRNHKCSDCDAVYSRIDTLRTHAKKRHHTVIPRYYYGIPANVWHHAIVQSTDQPKSHTVLPPKPQTITSGQLASVENTQ